MFRPGRQILTLLLALLLAGVATAAEDTRDLPLLEGRVTRVIDGDTLDVLLASGRIRVRLHGIDAPERDQPGGAEAGAWLRERMMNRIVQLEPVSQDQYGRMVAIVHDGDEVVNQALVGSGWAWAYRYYMRQRDSGLCDMEFQARQQARGLWGLAGTQAAAPRAPWEYRATKTRGPFTDYTGQSAADCRRQISAR